MLPPKLMKPYMMKFCKNQQIHFVTLLCFHSQNRPPPPPPPTKNKDFIISFEDKHTVSNMLMISTKSLKMPQKEQRIAWSSRLIKTDYYV